MSAELDALIALAADYNPITASLSPDTLAVFGYAYAYLGTRFNWIAPGEVADDVTDTDWFTIQDMVATAMREITINMIGQIIEWAGAALPPNMLECDGSTYLRVDYPDLYAVIDPAFITDADHFVVPDFRGKVAIGVSGSFAIGSEGGEEGHTLIVSELPSHDHSATGTTATDTGHVHSEVTAIPTITSISPGVPEPTAVPGIGSTGIGFASITVTDPIIGSTGGDGSHNNMQPYLAVRKVIIAN